MIGWDTEGALIRPGVLAPELACLTYSDGARSEIISGRDARAHFEWIFSQETCTANAPHDCATAWSWFPELGPLIWDAILSGRVHDVITRQKLIDIGEGNYRFFFKTVEGRKTKLLYNLSDLHCRYFGTHLEKDEWRLKYGPLRFIPVQAWDPGARNYAMHDARVTSLVHGQQEHQHPWMRRHPGWYLHNEIPQVQANWVLTLMAMHGVASDDVQVERVVDAIDREQPALKDKLMRAMLELPDGRRVHAPLARRDGTRKEKNARDRMYAIVGEAGELTKTGLERVAKGELTKDAALRAGYIKIDEEWCENCGDEMLLAYDEYSQNQLLRSKVLHFKTGPLPVHTSYEVLLETGRTSSSEHKLVWNSAALQNLSRKEGLRECIVAREGFALVASDFGLAELVSLSQVTYNWFEKGRNPGDPWYVECQMRRVLNEGKDIHVDFAADLLGLSYEEAYRRYIAEDPELIKYRQMAKPVNFGLPGGLSVDSLVTYARKSYGVKLTKREAKRLVERWLRKYPEMRRYFRWIRKMFDKKNIQEVLDEDFSDGKPAKKLVDITQEVTRRIRGKCRYTQACNTMFQGLTADAAKAALVEVSRRCYMDPTSALYGSRPALFVHDEVILETPIEKITSAAKELEEVMVEIYKRYTPDVRITADAHAMLRWSKKAKTRRDKSDTREDPRGRLLIWRDEKFEERRDDFVRRRRAA